MFKVIIDCGDLSNWLMVIATIILGFIAIFKDWLISKFLRPKLNIESHNIIGDLNELSNTQPLWFYHLKIKKKGFFSVKNCIILLKTVAIKNSDSKFIRFDFPIPRKFVWPGSQYTKEQYLDGKPKDNPVPQPEVNSKIFKNIIKEEIFDFGYIENPTNLKDEHLKGFIPAISFRGPSFDDKIHKLFNEGFKSCDQVVRYFLEIVAEPYFNSKEFIIVEVKWNGKWSNILTDMQKNIKISVDIPFNKNDYIINNNELYWIYK